jgi:hypothetical protein
MVVAAARQTLNSQSARYQITTHIAKYPRRRPVALLGKNRHAATPSLARQRNRTANSGQKPHQELAISQHYIINT